MPKLQVVTTTEAVVPLFVVLPDGTAALVKVPPGYFPLPRDRFGVDKNQILVASREDVNDKLISGRLVVEEVGSVPIRNTRIYTFRLREPTAKE